MTEQAVPVLPSGEISTPKAAEHTYNPQGIELVFRGHPHALFAVEPLPGQFDQRADSAAQCIQLMTQGERPAVRAAKVYLLMGSLSQAELDQIKRYLINPVECRGLNVACGAIGIGEITAIPTAPAIADAYFRYDGRFRTSLPLENTPYTRK